MFADLDSLFGVTRSLDLTFVGYVCFYYLDITFEIVFLFWKVQMTKFNTNKMFVFLQSYCFYSFEKDKMTAPFLQTTYEARKQNECYWIRKEENRLEEWNNP